VDQVDGVLTRRLRLRTWTDADRPAFAEMNGDPAVMEHLPAVVDRAGSDALMDVLRSVWAERGIGLWAVERSSGGATARCSAGPVSTRCPRAPRARGSGRSAGASSGRPGGTGTRPRPPPRAYAWRGLGLARLWSMTVPANVRSIAVMRRLGLVEHGRFDHPRFPEGHRLREHVAYVLDLS
jgi:RimJ/RimL family protein N-acetyltransferase